MKVAIFFGSKSDTDKMKKAAEVLSEFGVDYKAYILSAHRAGEILKQTVEQVEKDGCEMIVSICGEDISQMPSKIKQGKKDTVVFNEISSNIDLEYVLLDDRVKENIIVKEKRDFYNLSYHIQLKNLIPKYESSQKSITFYSKDTLEEMFYIPPPFMVDAPVSPIIKI